jgi:hypothetical protein
MWLEIRGHTLEADITCSNCGQEMDRGTHCMIWVVNDIKGYGFLCGECYDKIDWLQSEGGCFLLGSNALNP